MAVPVLGHISRGLRHPRSHHHQIFHSPIILVILLCLTLTVLLPFGVHAQQCSVEKCKGSDTFVTGGGSYRCSRNSSSSICSFVRHHYATIGYQYSSRVSTGCYCDRACTRFQDCCSDVIGSCDQMEIHRIEPLSVSTEGNTYVNVYGVSFNNTQVEYDRNLFRNQWDHDVLFDGVERQIDQPSRSRTYFKFLIPPGVGAGHTIQTRYSQSARSSSLPPYRISEPAFTKVSNIVTIDYDPPLITESSIPSTLPTYGRNGVTITGVNFGIFPDKFKCFLGTQQLTVSSLNHRSFIVNFPPGLTKNNNFYVVVGDQTSNTKFVSYESIVLSSISPTSGPTNGDPNPNALTITGSSFGSSGFSVFFGSSPITCTVNSTHTTLRCPLPPGHGRVAVRVRNSIGEYSALTLYFTYHEPVITSFTPQTLPTEGGLITLTGTNFFTDALITIGASPCTFGSDGTVLPNHTTATCRVAEGTGENYDVKLQVGLLQATAPSQFSYLPPVITGITPTQGPTQGGTNITITGSNFGRNHAEVSIKGVRATIVSRSHTQVVVRSPSGQGLNIPIQLSVVNRSTNSPQSFSYLPPTVSSITPSSTNTNGGIVVTIHGSNFGTSGLVNIGNVPCVPVSNGFNHDSIRCQVQPGMGSNNAVKVIIDSQESNDDVMFHYNRPEITSVTPQGLSTSGGNSITITGTSFGLSSGSVQIDSVDGACDITLQTHTAVVCTLPPLTKTDSLSVNIGYSIGGQATPTTIPYTYGKPVVQSVAPLGLPSIGGGSITITGTSFSAGSNGTQDVVTVGGNPCPITAWSHTQIVCTLPISSKFSSEVTLTTHRDGSASTTTPFYYTYAHPVITQVNPSVISTDGSTTVTLTGMHLNLLQDNGNVEIRAGNSLCDSPAPVEGSNHTEVTCRPKPGVGLNNDIFIRYTNVQLTSSTTLLTNIDSNRLTYSFHTPTLASIAPTSGPTQGGGILTLTGANFGPESSLDRVSISFGTQFCTAIKWVSHSSLTCTVPMGSRSAQVHIIAGNAISNSLTYTYDPPVIDSIEPQHGPTQGGNIITLRGSSFDANPSVTVAGTSCKDVQVNASHTELTCSIPPGQGIDKSVAVIVSGLSSNEVLYSYDQPTITSVTPLSADTATGTTITIVGANFGLNGQVSVGNDMCQTVTHGHTQITCKVPPGQGKDLGVSIDVDIFSAIATETFSFNPPQLVSVLMNGDAQPLPTQGNYAITLTGSNFGTYGEVTVDGKQCFATGKGFAHTQIECILPEAVDLSTNVAPIEITISEQTTTGEVTYAPPRITAISPSKGPTEGGYFITITGTSFGSGAQPIQEVTIGSQQCVLSDPTDWSHRQIICQAPIGNGEDLPVTVKSSTGEHTPSTITFSYDLPNVVVATPDLIPTIGGVLVTITGTSFDIYDPATSVAHIDGKECVVDLSIPEPTTSWNSNEIKCMAPAGTGKDLSVMITRRDGRQSGRPGVLSYEPPLVTTIVADSIHNNNMGQVAGGNTVTITGSSFGTDADVVKVNVDGNPCPVLTVSDNTIVCTYPPGVGQVILSTTINGQVSNDVFFTYDSPRLTTPPTPLSGFTQGGDIITVYGYNLATKSYDAPITPPPSVLPYATITIGGNVCEFIDVVVPETPSLEHTDAYTCRVPVGSGTNRPLLASFHGQFSNQISFNYLAPVIDTISPSVDIPTTPGQLITIEGNSFGLVPYPVYIGLSTCSSSANDDETSWSHQRIVCRLQAGEGTNLLVSLSIGSLQSNPMTVSRAAPSITSIAPRSGTSAGGNTLTITGTNFGTMGSPRSVTVDGQPCTSLSADPATTHTILTCLLPPGNGSDLDVILTVAGQSSLPHANARYSYSGPTIHSVFPQLPTTGGTLTITGSSFTQGSTITVGSSPCSVTSVNVDGTQIQCTVVAGRGVGLPVTVVSSALTSTCGATDPADCLFSYLPPVITNLRPQLVRTDSKGTAITVTGANFGPSPAPSNGGVQIGPYQCNVSYWSHLSIECFIDQGSGVNHAVVVSMNGQTYPSTPTVPTLSFIPPSITSISSATSYPAAGGSTITISGANFGALQSNVQVVFDSDDTPAITITSFVPHSTIIGTLHPNIGAVPLRVIVDGQSSSPYTIRYDAPVVTSVSGCTVAGLVATSCEMNGGDTLVIMGTNFCRPDQPSTDFASITPTLRFVMGTSTTEAPLSITSIDCSGVENTITTTVPEFIGGQLTSLRLTVAVFGRSGYLNNAVSYAGPSIIPASIMHTSSTTPSTAVEDLQTASGVETVSFLAANLAGVDTITSVKYGPVEDPYRYTCLSPTVSDVCPPYAPTGITSCYVVTCPLEGGVGSGHRFTLYATIPLSSGNVDVVSAQGSDMISFTPPTIAPFSLQLTTSPSSALPDVDCDVVDCTPPFFVQGRVVDGQYIQLRVSHVHLNSQYISVNYGLASTTQPFALLNDDDDDAFPMRCGDVHLIPISGEDAFITCRLSVGSGKPYIFQVTAYNTKSTPSTDEYHYPDAPQIVSVHGCPVDQTESTENCPTRGDLTLTIRGTQFGNESTLQTVYIGSEICQILQYTPAATMDELDVIQCLLPPGAGTQTVSVAAGALWSSAVPWVTYHAPVISSITTASKYCKVESPLSLIDCQREAEPSYTITIRGEYFGPPSSTSLAHVFVGGLTCEGIVHTPGKEHEEVICQVPENRGQKMNIVLLQASSSTPSANTAELSYITCKPGYYNLFNTVVCEPCAPGEYTDTEETYLPIPCPAGTFTASTASTSCSNCAIGTFSQGGATECTDCSPGTYAPTVASATCLDCSPGTFAASAKQGVCAPCPIGHSQPLSGQDTCVACAAGSFQPVEGKATCQQCVQGRFQPDTGKAVCDMCPPGHFQDQPGQTSCKQCPVGQAQINSGQARCDNCGSGQFADKPGTQACSVCPQGHFSVNTNANNTGPTQCEPCTAGTYQPNAGQSSCIDCSPGTFSDTTAQTQCIPCATGHHQLESQQTSCDPCPEGTFADTLGTIVCSPCIPGRYNDVTAQSVCKLCPIGTYTDTSSSVECKPCAAGHYNDALGQSNCPQCNSGTYTDQPQQSSCLLCPEGHYNQQDPNDSSSTASCLECPVGLHAESLGSDTCSPCPSGSVASTTGTVLCELCAPGTFADYTTNTCSPCPAGSFNNVYGAISCSPCLPGTFADIAGSTQCSDCEAGYHQPTSGQPSCLECAPGSFSLEGASICTKCSPGTFNPDPHQDRCQPCPTGTFEPDAGQATECSPCADGYYTDATGSTSCQSCSPGTYTDSTMTKDRCEECGEGTFSGTAAGECSPCPVGTYNPVTGQSSCLDCPIGTANNVLGQAQCAPCNPGFYQDDTGQTECSSCPDGTYSDGTGFSTCKDCPIGQRSINDDDVDRTTDPDAPLIRDACLLCTPGTYAPKQGQTTCTACAPGTFSNINGAFVCEECSPGKVQPLSGQSTCEDCAAGSYQDLQRQAECKPCSVGTASSSTGQTRCADCLPGFYQDETGQSQCKECQPGTISPDVGASECTECSPGSYQDNSAQSSCIDCPGGSFSVDPGQATCNECEPGYHQPEVGQTECLPCGLGHHALGYGSALCTPCVSGTFADVEGLTTCKPCEPGSANDQIGSSSCEPCEEGFYSSLSGAISCTECDAGSYQALPGQTECIPCDFGQYQPAKGKSQCLPCAPGSFASVAGRPTCSLCPLGYANDEDGQRECDGCIPGFAAGEEGLEACDPCPAGYYSNTHSSFECLACPPGRYAANPEQSLCDACAPGEFQNAFGQQSCKKCPAGTFSSSEASSSCQKCALGTYADEEGLSECKSTPAGSTNNDDFTNFKLCPPGTHASTERSPRCSQCSPGTHADGEGNTTCNLCEPGTFSNASGQATCEQCPIGTYASASGSTQCDPCPSGTFADTPGSPVCTPCARGSYSQASQSSNIGPSSCIPCQKGFYQSLTGQSACIACPIGQFSPETGAEECTLCPRGQFSDVPGRSSCANCAPGHYASNPGSPKCLECQPGRYQELSGQPECLPCRSGFHQPESGQQECIQCDIGHFARNSGSTLCSLCEPGSMGPAEYTTIDEETGAETLVVRDTSECVLCNPGYYQDASGATECKGCDIGWYGEGFGSTICQMCPPGTYSDQPNSGQCTPCPVGFYQDQAGQSECKECTPGFFSGAEGRPQCAECPIGTYSDVAQASECINCPAGHYNTLTGQTECRTCPPGRFATVGQSSCTLCPDSTATELEMSDHCVPCGVLAISSQDRTECLCKPGYFLPAFTPGSNEWNCQECPTGADCRQPGTRWDNLSSLPGYWRPSDTSYDFIRCPVAEQCVGGPAKSAQFKKDGSSGSACDANRVGIACSSCADGYRPAGTSCLKCQEGATQYVVLSILAIVVIILIIIACFFILRAGDEILRQVSASAAENDIGPRPLAAPPVMVEMGRMQNLQQMRSSGATNAASSVDDTDGTGNTTMDDNDDDDSLDEELSDDQQEQQEEDYQEEFDRTMAAIHAAPPPATNFTYKFKIIITFIQIAYSVTTDLHFRWPKAYKDVFSFMGITSIDFLLESVTGADCFSKENYYPLYFVYLIVPIVVLLLILALWVVPRELRFIGWRSLSTFGRLRSRIQSWRIILFFIFIVFPMCSSVVIRHYVCHNIEGEHFLMADYRVQCFDYTWNVVAFVSIIFLLIYPIGIPAFIWFVINSYKHQLGEPRVKAQLGFLYAGYKSNMWAWEIVDSFHKLILVAIIAFLPYAAQLQVALAVIAVYLILLLFFNPYIDSTDDFLHQLAQVELLLLVLAGFMFESFKDRELTKLEDISLSVLLLIATFGLIIVFLYFAFFTIRQIYRLRKAAKSQANAEDEIEVSDDDDDINDDEHDDDDDDDQAGVDDQSGHDDDRDQEADEDGDSGDIYNDHPDGDDDDELHDDHSIE